MELFSVQSSNISQIGYEKEERIVFNQDPISVLRIIFTSGITYDFYDVPQDIFIGLKDATSVGKYFNQNIKNRYNYEKRG